MIVGRRPLAVPDCVRRALPEFPHAPGLVASLRSAIEEPLGRRLGYHVHGSFARACITGERFTDVDVVAASRADRTALQSLGRRPLVVRGVAGERVSVRLDVARRVVTSPVALLGGIELVMARVAFSTTDDCFHMDPDCLEAIATRTLIVRPVSSRLVTPARTIRRTLKYAARGWHLPLETLLRSLDEYRGTPAIVRWGEYGLRAVFQRDGQPSAISRTEPGTPGVGC